MIAGSGGFGGGSMTGALLAAGCGLVPRTGSCELITTHATITTPRTRATARIRVKRFRLEPSNSDGSSIAIASERPNAGTDDGGLGIAGGGAAGGAWRG